MHRSTVGEIGYRSEFKDIPTAFDTIKLHPAEGKDGSPSVAIMPEA